MSSIDRLHKFAELLCQAIPDLDPASLSPRPLDAPTAAAHVGRLRTRDGEPGRMRVVFSVSESSNFVPMAFVTCEDTQAAMAMALSQDFVGDKPAPPIGTSFNFGDANSLTQMGVAGWVLLRPGTMAALSEFVDGIANGGEVFEPRLAVFLDAAELNQVGDLPALINGFSERGRSVFLARREA